MVYYRKILLLINNLFPSISSVMPPGIHNDQNTFKLICCICITQLGGRLDKLALSLKIFEILSIKNMAPHRS